MARTRAPSSHRPEGDRRGGHVRPRGRAGEELTQVGAAAVDVAADEVRVACLERGRAEDAAWQLAVSNAILGLLPEPLPDDSPLWRMPNVLITPHVAIYGTPYRDKWEAILIENCRRFAAGQTLLNVVDKVNWY